MEASSMADPTQREVSRWVADQLHELVGLSDRVLVDFVVELARKERSPAALAKQLLTFDLPDSAATRRFAAELVARAAPGGGGGGGGGAGGAAAARAAEALRRKETRALLRSNDAYAMLDDDDGDGEAGDAGVAPLEIAPPRPPPAAPSARKRARAAAVEPAADGRASPPPERSVTGTQPESATAAAGVPTSAPAADAPDDAAERDAFAERVRLRDAERTRRLVGGGSGSAAEAARRKLEAELAAADAETRDGALGELRKASRRKYLEGRERLKLDEARDELEDEAFLFEGQKLSKRERAELELKRELYELAQQRVAKVDVDDRYRMPDAYDGDGVTAADRAKRMDLATARYADEAPVEASEQEQWESAQLAKATARVGARAGRERSANDGFELELGDQIAFVTDEVIAGTLGGGGGGEAGSKDGALARGAAPPPVQLTSAEATARERASLPIYPYRDELLAAVAQYQVLVIVGETGSGKTTQIPQYMHEGGYTAGGKKVGCTQPRRVAAMSVAKRVADELGCKLGHEVGYSIRFEDCTSERTVLKYMTDGMLLREFLSEPDLAAYSVMMLDEAHERTLHTDVLFGLLKDVARFRPELKLLISSATLDAAKFSDYFDGAPVFNIPGRRYPVDILYTQAPEADYMEAAVVTVLQIHLTQPAGDVLVFFTGQEEIEAAMEALAQRTRGFGTKLGELLVLPIYANLPSDMQAKIFEKTPPGARKVVLATNIAETSITIDNIVYVIDPGFVKMNSYNPRSGVESLIVTPCARSQANQRAGRSGRVAPGKCFRLYTKWAYLHELDDNVIPEIQRTNLGNVVLLLKSLGINDLLHFDFMDPPPAETLIRALEQLYALGALNDKGELTKLGRQMAEFPLDPQMAKALIAAGRYHVADCALAVCAMLSIGNSVFYRPKDKAVHADNARIAFNRPHGDHPTMLHVYRAWAECGYGTQWCYDNFIQVRSMKRARDVHEQLAKLCERAEIELAPAEAADPDGLRKAILSGYFYNTAKLQGSGDYRTVKNPQTVHVHPSSALAKDPPRWVVFHELVFTTKEYMRTITEIRPEWLVEIAPHYYQARDIDVMVGKKLPKGAGLSAQPMPGGAAGR
ncbi:hypothetical protein KFE25_008276 [Diacronema lutheri]|uniref:RNA helicase n=1 Tax=Diacronema lutheri TaxID=2081491 RepID=A0A8J6C9U5_DIALT|nr:hypothetical protein KFE25_008276 [Diacronema lutheri]